MNPKPDPNYWTITVTPLGVGDSGTSWTEDQAIARQLQLRAQISTHISGVRSTRVESGWLCGECGDAYESIENAAACCTEKEY